MVPDIAPNPRLKTRLASVFSEFGQIRFQLKVQFCVTGQGTGTQGRADPVFRDHFRRRLDHLGVCCQSQVVVGCDLEVLNSVQLNAGKTIGNRKTAKEDIGIKMIAGHFFHPAPKLVAFIKNICHEKVFC